MIRNREYHAQFVDFSNMQFGKIAPMDFDGFIDFGDKLFVFIETKYLNQQMPFGQRLALERLVDATQSDKRASIAFITSHNKQAANNEDIDLGNSIVTEYRFHKQWIKPLLPIKLYDAVKTMKDRYIHD